MKQGKIKVVIPSRLGSNRVKMKGMRLLDGQTLVEHTLDNLKKTKHLTDIYINSDSELWAKLAKKHNVKFYLRKKELATSQSMIDDYLYDFMIGEPSDYLAVVTPTSPFFSAESLDSAWEQYSENDYDTIISGEEIQTHCFYKGKPMNFSRIGQLPRSQDLDPIIALNFSIAIYDCNKFKANYENLGWGVFTGKLGFFKTDGFANIDIDEEKDFLLAEIAARFMRNEEDTTPKYSEFVQHLIDAGVDTTN